LDTADQTITSEERVKLQTQVRDNFDKFASAFAEIVQLLATRQENVINVLDAQSAICVEQLAVLRTSSFETLDFTSANYASQARDTFSQMQVHIIQYLATGNERFANQAEQDFGTIRFTLDLLKASARGDASRNQVDQISAAAMNYYDGFTNIRKLTARQRDLMANQLDVYGPAVDESATEIANSINREFAAQNLASSALVFQTGLRVMVASGLIVVLGLI